MNDRPDDSRILYQLINYKNNQDLLERLAYITYLDMAIVFYYWNNPENVQEGARLISRTDMREWEMPVEELELLASRNTPKRMPVAFHSMDDLIRELAEIPKDKKIVRDIPMHILTNKDKIFGAAAILYPQVLWAISQTFEEDLYVLPSSVHECILVPASVNCSLTELEEMVHDVNRTYVAQQEILSDHVYYYNGVEDALFYREKR